MKTRQFAAAAVSAAIALAWTAPARAHCDTLDGPVVSAARRALDSGNVNHVLAWVQKGDEIGIRDAFLKASSVRKAGGPAKELADAYFYEALVRVHREGEGAPYTGLKPAGEIEPPVAAADKAIQSGKLGDLAKVIAQRTEKGLHGHFDKVMEKKGYKPNDVEAGRAYVGAYVQFVHYVERLYDAADAKAAEHAHAAPERTEHPHGASNRGSHDH